MLESRARNLIAAVVFLVLALGIFNWCTDYTQDPLERLILNVSCVLVGCFYALYLHFMIKVLKSFDK
jgi:hypothetical protein